MVSFKFKTSGNPVLEYKFLCTAYDVYSDAGRLLEVMKQRLDGVINDDVMMDLIERRLVGTNKNVMDTISYGNSLLTDVGFHWYRYAIALFNSIKNELLNFVEIVVIIDEQSLKKYVSKLKMLRGAIAFAILDGLNILANISEEFFKDEWSTSEGIDAFVADKLDGNKLFLIKELYDSYASSSPFVPVEVEFPELFSKFADYLEDYEMGSAVLEYSNLLYMQDVCAILSGKLLVDEDLVAHLKNRECSDYLPAKLYQYKFAQYLQAIPENYYNTIILYEDRLSEELIDYALDYGFDAAFIKRLAGAKLLKDVYTDIHIATGQDAIAVLNSIMSEEVQIFG